MAVICIIGAGDVFDGIIVCHMLLVNVTCTENL